VNPSDPGDRAVEERSVRRFWIVTTPEYDPERYLVAHQDGLHCPDVCRSGDFRMHIEVVDICIEMKVRGLGSILDERYDPQFELGGVYVGISFDVAYLQ
jgi:hypothetical protein